MKKHDTAEAALRGIIEEYGENAALLSMIGLLEEKGIINGFKESRRLMNKVPKDNDNEEATRIRAEFENFAWFCGDTETPGTNPFPHHLNITDIIDTDDCLEAERRGVAIERLIRSREQSRSELARICLALIDGGVLRPKLNPGWYYFCLFSRLDIGARPLSSEEVKRKTQLFAKEFRGLKPGGDKSRKRPGKVYDDDYKRGVMEAYNAELAKVEIDSSWFPDED